LAVVESTRRRLFLDGSWKRQGKLRLSLDPTFVLKQFPEWDYLLQLLGKGTLISVSSGEWDLVVRVPII
jgi:hypothetical protein